MIKEKVLQMTGINKNFPGVKALVNAQLTLYEGEVHALVGENGAGKSTLMKILTGIYQKDEGEIIYLGKKLEVTNPRQALEIGIGMIHQELNLAADLTVAQNILLGREPKAFLKLVVKEKQLIEKTKELCQRLKLDLNPREDVGNLTVAKQQMVEIAKALSYQSKILIMDEPTAALTETEIDVLFSIISELKKQGVAIVYISHRMDELMKITDKISVMRDGMYIDTVYTNETTIQEIIKMMVGRDVGETKALSAFHDDNEVVLEVRNLSRGRSIKDVSFSVRKGEIVGFAGLMGAGRTEVARAIFGADKADAGEIFVKGKKVKINHPNQAVKHGIGYLSEDRKQFGLLLDKDVKMNIGMSSLKKFYRAGVANEKKLANKAEEMTKSLRIKTPSIHQEVRFLSGGNQQKVVIGKWLTENCDILIFDEPTRGIDVGAKEEIYKLLHELIQQDKTIIVISSELPEIMKLSHRVIVMCEGRITGNLLNKDLTQEEIMSHATKRA